MVDGTPVFARVQLEQGGLGLRRRVGRGAGELQPVRDAEHVRVHRDALHDAERLVEHDVRRLATHARQLLQLVYVARDLAAVVGHYHLSALDDVRRLRMEEADGADDAFNVAGIGRCEIRGRGVALPQRGRDLVHAFVGGLGAQQYGDGQAERIAPVVQRALGGGVMLVHALRTARARWRLAVMVSRGIGSPRDAVLAKLSQY